MLNLDFADKRQAVYQGTTGEVATIALIGVALALLVIALFANTGTKVAALVWATLP
jgi:hypothetical protein